MTISLLPKCRKVVVVFEKRADGGVRIYSDDVPGFVLSHQDVDAAEGDVIPALEAIISEMLGLQVRVELLSPLREAVPGKPVFGPGAELVRREYVTQRAA